MKKIVAVMFVVVGILSIILGICAYDMPTGSYEYNESYGGDAYTGIQNAAAQGANNTIMVADAVVFAAGSVLLVGGLAMIAVGANTWPDEIDFAALAARVKSMPAAAPQQMYAPQMQAEPVAAEEATVFCGQCGNKQVAGTEFCAACGNKIQ